MRSERKVGDTRLGTEVYELVGDDRVCHPVWNQTPTRHGQAAVVVGDGQCKRRNFRPWRAAVAGM